MKQPVFAPVMAGGSLVTGATVMLIGGYQITSCFIYNPGYKTCDATVEANALSVVSGAAGIAGVIGGLFTYNRRLDREEVVAAVAQPAPISAPPLPAPPDPPALELQQGANLHSDSPEDDETLDRMIRLYEKRGLSQETIAELLDITRYRVRKVLAPDTL